MEKLTAIQFSQKVLENAKCPLTQEEIHKEGVRLNLPSTFGAKTPWQTIGAQLYVNMRDKEDSPFYIASKRPTRFWLKSRKNELANNENIAKFEEEQEKIEKAEFKKRFNERDLHPLLVKFLNESNEFNCYCKTIFHEKSKKGISGQDKWNFPDIVGVHFPFSDDFERETLEFLGTAKKLECKLYSFELKIELNWSNLKEYYFQAVSNSSWANEGYLVVFRDFDNEILAELRRLNASFGIGIIKLEAEISRSKILVLAKEKPLDTQTLDMLVGKNEDFKDFITKAKDDLKENRKDRLQIKNYDEIFSDDKIEKHLKDKNIDDKSDE